MDRISLDAVNLALYVLPGAIFLYVRSQMGRGYRPEWSGILIFATAYYMASRFLWSAMGEDYRIPDAALELSVDWKILLWSVVLPAVLGVLFGWKGSYLVDRQAPWRERLKEVFSFRQAVVQTAWYHVFNSDLTAKIRVTFEDGSVIDGWYTGSATMSKEEPHDLFVSRSFSNANDQLKHGWWIPRSKVKAIEVMEFEHEER